VSDSFYKSPENISVPETPLLQPNAITEPMINYLKQASPWLRFVGILGFIFCGMSVFGGVILIIVMLAVSGLSEELGWSVIAIGLIYLPLGALYFFPSLFTYRFGTKIRNYMINNSEKELELAFKNNKSFWKFTGILCIIMLAFIPLTFVIAIIGGLAAVLF
jgi:hypothetical protein